MKPALPLIYLRSGCFYLCFFLFTIVWSILAMIAGPTLPYNQRFRFIIGNYARAIMWLLRWCCDIHYHVSGLDNIPERPCVIYSKHQSTWETFFLQTLFAPQSQVIKKGLLAIPFFGWAFSLLAPIAIDREKRREAMEEVITQGKRRLDDGIWVLIFPEGTRVNPGERKPFSRGGATLAKESGYPLLPIAHNAGLFWPNNRFLKFPGTVRVVIGRPIAPDQLAVEALTATGERWINDTVEALSDSEIAPQPSPATAK
ncbi:lysophospholipid acyltransferase family protein [Mangrovitalea sediminis]|uniref:lysophospholipid acyltransferase family protein n=1 Tax=Mangrovitalea sediminis TaxID=1982043 RepID=UPI000BE54AD1|nr:lysophospholipid acyltransferase family protein [Mangrovitalea sediminis]